MASTPEERQQRKAARAAIDGGEDRGFQPTGRHLDLAREAIEAAWMLHLAEIGRYAIRKRMRLLVSPPDAMAIYAGAKALGLREAAITDWGGDETQAISQPAADVKDGDQLIP